MNSTLSWIAPIYLALLLFLSPTLLRGEHHGMDSTLQTNTILPLPLKNITPVISNNNILQNIDITNLRQINFTIANPSRQQFTDWLAGDHLSLNQIFSGGGPKSKSDLLDSTLVFIGKARETIKQVKAAGNFVAKLTGEDLQTLPVGITKTLGDQTKITAGVRNIYLYPEYAALEIYVEVTSPNFPQPLFFAAPDVKFSRLGGLSGVVSLGLLGDFTLPVFEDKATILLKSALLDSEKDEFKTGIGTYAEFSCDGIEKISVDANLAISRKILLPANTDVENPDTNQTVNANFFVSTENGISDIVTEINFEQPFYHVKNDKLIWTIQSAILDFSTLQHRNTLQFPVGNYNPLPTLATKENWTGVYIKKIGIAWKDPLSEGSPESPTSFSINATNIVIDEAGFTGRLSVENLMPLSDQRQVDKWAFSIDLLEVSILTNTFESLDFTGHLGMPMTNPDPDNGPDFNPQNLINYSGSFDFTQRRYTLSGNLPTDKILPLKMFKGQIVIENTSVFTIGYEADKVFLSADLNADFETKSQDEEDEQKLSVPLVEVTGLQVSSKSPFLLATGDWMLRDTISVASFANFGLNINALFVQKDSQTMDTELIVGASINLAAGDKIHISGATVVRMTGNIEDTPTTQRWKFKDVNLDMIAIEADLESFSLSGRVIFFKNLDGNGDISYGSGFQGDAELRIKGLNKKDEEESGNMGTGFKAMALFGTAKKSNNDPFRYFMVDVLAFFENGIPIGPIGLYGVGGGVYYRMQQEDPSSSFASIPAFEPPVTDDTNTYENYINSFLGTNLSGTKYRPSETSLIGINLNVILGATPNPKAFSSNIGLNMEFNTNGGLNFIKLNGIMNVMADLPVEGPACSGVSLAVEMEYVFKTSSQEQQKGFYASAHAFVKVSALRGAVPRENIPARFADYIDRCSPSDLGYAGGLEMQFSKNYWFLNVGTPSSKLGLQINLGVIGPVGLSTYFDIGKNIPPFPGLPANVRSLTRMGNILQNEMTRASGQGFAFGVSFDASLDTPNFLGFSAHVALGVGFDIMLNKFRDANCLNSGSPKPIGINNWYAAGQAWAYLDAKVKFLGAEVLGLGLAAALQIKGPNPTFGRGTLAGRVRIAFVKKNFNIHFQFGEECRLQGSQVLEQEIPIVLFMTPSNDDQGVDVGTEIDVVFAQELNTTFQSVNGNTNESEDFVIRMESFEITDPDGNPVAVSLEKLSGQFYRYLPIDQLRSNTEYTLTLVAKLFRNEDELIETEERIHIFKTGDFPKEIFNQNIDYALPGDGQFNFYKFDNASEYIQLRQGQEELLAELPEDRDLKVKISTTHPVSISYQDCAYHAGMNRLNYTLPGNLVNGKSYKLEIVNVPVEEFSNYVSASDLELDEFNLPAPFENEKVYHTMAFRVSDYNRFRDKMSAIAFSDFLAGPVTPRPTLHPPPRPQSTQVSNISEPFGIEEVEGIYDNPPSLVFEADLENTPWIVNHYRNYTDAQGQNMDIYGYADSDRISNYLDQDRVTYFGNREPAKGIFIIQDSIFQVKLNAVFPNNNGVDFSAVEIKIDYALAKIMHKELSNVSDYLLNEKMADLLPGDLLDYIDVGGEGSNDYCTYPELTMSGGALKTCCEQRSGTYSQLLHLLENRLTASPGLFKKFFYLSNNRTKFCKLTNKGFSKRNLFTDLQSGNYPFSIRYYLPTSSSPHETFTKTLIKN